MVKGFTETLPKARRDGRMAFNVPAADPTLGLSLPDGDLVRHTARVTRGDIFDYDGSRTGIQLNVQHCDGNLGR